MQDPKCKGKIPTQLPIWGAARFGDQTHPPGLNGDLVPSFLSQGTVTVFARAHENLLGIKFPSLVYKVNSFDIPPGAVVSTENKNESSAVWRGNLQTSKDSIGFTVHATARPEQMIISIPGDPVLNEKALIDLGSYPQFLQDPNLITIQVIAGVFVFLIKSLQGFFLASKKLLSSGSEKSSN